MLNKQKVKAIKKERRKRRTRSKIYGTKKVPRLSVFKSSKHIYCQLINDEESKTLVSASDKLLEQKDIKALAQKEGISAGIAAAYEVGKLLAKNALDKKIKECVFDKSSFKYHGRVKAVAEGARAGGLKF